MAAALGRPLAALPYRLSRQLRPLVGPGGRSGGERGLYCLLAAIRLASSTRSMRASAKVFSSKRTCSPRGNVAMATRLVHPIRSSGRRAGRGWGPRSTAGAGFGILADLARGVRGATKFLPTVLLTVASRFSTPLFRLTGNGLFVGTHRPLRYEQRELTACAGELQGLRGNGDFVYPVAHSYAGFPWHDGGGPPHGSCRVPISTEAGEQVVVEDRDDPWRAPGGSSGGRVPMAAASRSGIPSVSTVMPVSPHPALVTGCCALRRSPSMQV